jgi:hypothetical protein
VRVRISAEWRTKQDGEEAARKDDPVRLGIKPAGGHGLADLLSMWMRQRRQEDRSILQQIQAVLHTTAD